MLGLGVALLRGSERSLPTPPQDFLDNLLAEGRAEVTSLLTSVGNLRRDDHIVAIASGWAIPALNDLESKFVEGGLGWIEISEFKNFTHGRFMNSLAVSDGAILVHLLSADQIDERAYIESLCPQGNLYIPVQSKFRGILGAVDLVVHVFALVEILAERKNVDIQRPHVPDFARKLFSGEPLYHHFDAVSRLDGFVRRRLFEDLGGLNHEGDADLLSYTSQIQARLRLLLGQRFDVVAFDFDGTLVTSDRSKQVLSSASLAQLVNFINSGVKLVVLTGRGSSVVRFFEGILERQHLEQITFYLYNGAVCSREIGRKTIVRHRLSHADELFASLKEHPELTKLVGQIKMNDTMTQITLHLADPRLVNECQAHVAVVLASFPGIKAVTSGVTIDLVSHSVSKSEALDHFSREIYDIGVIPSILSLGDRGDLGGNDWELLQHPFSIAVDRYDQQGWAIPLGALLGCHNSGELITEGVLNCMEPVGHQLRIDSGRFADWLLRSARLS
jgi:hydroxymethylpyrimidine pyrophosphatase-like HAD family hydrolase